jgi:hypothetical protein
MTTVDDTEELRRAMLTRAAEQGPLSREQLEAKYGDVYDTDQLRQTFMVHNFLAPFISATRIADGVKGSMEFQHHPRFYFCFIPHEKANR